MKAHSFAWIAFLLFTSSADAGGMVGNGGDSILQEFNLRGIQLAAFLKDQPALAQAHGINPAQFFETVRSTRLSGHDRLFLGGREVDAINYPWENRIEVNRTRWKQTATRADAYFAQRQIALHEYLWVYGINDEGYAVSNPIIAEIERSAGPLVDPEVRKLMFKNLCEALSREDIARASALVSWGLDLNADCISESHGTATPLQIILNPFRFPASGPTAEDRMRLIRRMFVFGANPNQMGSFLRRSILVDAVIYYPGVAQMLLEFGADPNALDEDGASAFSVIAAVNGGKYLRADTLRMIMEAGGDVNLTGSHSSPAQTIVSSEGNAEIVEALIQTGKVEWCRSMDPYWGQRTIDRVSAEHLPLLRRYGISCSRFERVFGKGESCALAKDAGRMQCMNEGFQFATLGPTRNGAECIIYREAQEGPEMYLATYFCSDESLDLSPNYAQESTLSIELATIRTLRCP